MSIFRRVGDCSISSVVVPELPTQVHTWLRSTPASANSGSGATAAPRPSASAPGIIKRLAETPSPAIPLITPPETASVHVDSAVHEKKDDDSDSEYDRTSFALAADQVCSTTVQLDASGDAVGNVVVGTPHTEAAPPAQKSVSPAAVAAGIGNTPSSLYNDDFQGGGVGFGDGEDQPFYVQAGSNSNTSGGASASSGNKRLSLSMRNPFKKN
jgi:hypothetical protein